MSKKKQPSYPVYVISKGRWQSLMTVRALDRMGVDHSIVVEPQEQASYAAALEQCKVKHASILVTPFSNLGRGSIPVRNFVFDHAAKHSGKQRHWILDDNISCFYIFTRNAKVPVRSGVSMQIVEQFTDQFTNVPLSGMQYEMFVPRRSAGVPPLYINTRVYSCILLDHTAGFRWRGRYNEDTDLSLRILKAGQCTLLFNVCLADKAATMTMRGGNTDELYRQDACFDGRLAMARSLQRQHPDVVKVTRKWGRWQHHVNYKPFKGNRLKWRTDRPRVFVDLRHHADEEVQRLMQQQRGNFKAQS